VKEGKYRKDHVVSFSFLENWPDSYDRPLGP